PWISPVMSTSPFCNAHYQVLSFFFQAEDGIRDRNVTGVQTCALPISGGAPTHPGPRACSAGPTRCTFFEESLPSLSGVLAREELRGQFPHPVEGLHSPVGRRRTIAEFTDELFGPGQCLGGSAPQTLKKFFDRLFHTQLARGS